MVALGKWLLANERYTIAIALVALLLGQLLQSQLLGLISPLLVMLVSLVHGSKRGLVMLSWLVIPALSLLWLHQFNVQDMLFLRCIVAWLMASLLGVYCSWRLLLEVSALVGVVIIVALHILHPDIVAWWQHFFQEALVKSPLIMKLKLGADELAHIASTLAATATGFAVTAILVFNVLLLMLARFWQSMLFNSGGFKKEFLALSMSRAVAIAALVIAVLGYFKLGFIEDIVAVVLLPFFFSGLSFIHHWVEIKPQYLFVLFILYFAIATIVLAFYAVTVVVTLGLLDSFVHWRSAFIKDTIT